MAVYKIFPTKDSSILSYEPERNTGLGEILDASTKIILDTPQVNRILIQFSQDEINNLFSTYISSSQWKGNLKLFSANIEGLNTDTTIETFPVYQSWSMGTGKFNDSPPTENGTSWIWATYPGGDPWITSSFPSNVTSSFSSSSTPGGGNWYYTSSNANASNVRASQLYSYSNPLDLNLNVSNIIHNWVSESFDNNGFIIKQSNNDEFINNENRQTTFKLFSIDTHTIYPPVLEISWEDYIFNTGSSSQQIINTTELFISLKTNTNYYYPNSIIKFRINCRPLYPERTFSTSSIYTQNYYLPEESYYALQDLDTNEYIIDFDNIFTKISADDISSYFTIYMDGLQPERYYKILIKTSINGSTLVLDNDYYFKIING
jgi:hypothetical protein